MVLDPIFGPLFWGKLFVSTGVWVHGVAAVILVYRATGFTTLVAMVSVVQFTPQLRWRR